MFERILNQFREKCRSQAYVMTLHAEEEMSDDGLSIFDVEHAILAGKISKRQKDQNTAEWKYLITGDALDGTLITVVAKMSPRDKMVIITVYVE